jgi:hypothetical protein
MLKIVGDINFSDAYFDTGFGIGSKILKGLNPFENIVFSTKDIFIGNFECVCSTSSNKKGIYKNQFIINPEFIRNIRHFDVYSVANNHSMQHGEEAFQETIKNIEGFGSAVIGTLNKKCIYFEHNSYKVGMMSFSYRHENFSSLPQYWHLPSLFDISHEFNKIADCDLKIAYIHWGNEFINRPYFDQKIIARNLVDIGFDLVAGVHPHVLQGFEIYKGKYIFYSLGNFLFNMPTEDTHYSIILNIDLDASKNILIDYSYIRLDNSGFPKIIEISEVPDKFQFAHLNEIISNDCENEKYYHQLFDNIKKYRFKNILSIIRSTPKYKLNVLSGILSDFIKRRLKL